ncbi:cellulose binding domain-containing protein [Micromonospora sp. NPDC048839]|uniref:cellulose binding domain-containing protein n=1 Tax=Micromonospora sp. NPDC048839 TaxID=3155641 RepID=UPI0033F7517F
MIEIGAQVDLSHPPDRVWLALTDRKLLGRWFAEAATVEGVADRLLLRTAELPGFEADVEVEVTERREAALLVLTCDEAGRLSELTCAVTATSQGCRLEVREVTTHGAWSADQHDPREQQVRQALTVRLPAILDWLAFQQVDLRRGDGAMTTELPLIALRTSGRTRRRRRTLVALIGGAALLAGTAAWITLPPESTPTAAPASAGAPSPSGTTAAARKATPSVRPSRSTASTTTRPSPTATATATATPPSPAASAVPPPPPASPVPVVARYETESSRLFGYTGAVVVENPSGVPVADWAVVVTLGEGTTVDDVDGANWRQDGRSITFTGAEVAAGGTRTISFDVRDSRPKARQPASCTIGGQPCAGL